MKPTMLTLSNIPAYFAIVMFYIILMAMANGILLLQRFYLRMQLVCVNDFDGSFLLII